MRTWIGFEPADHFNRLANSFAMKRTIVPVILSGGAGTRLWPLSRSMRPKQFINLIDDESLFQKTLLRIRDLPDVGQPVVVCYEEHRFMVAEQLQELGMKGTIILEPSARDTAPAITSAAVYLDSLSSDNQHIMVVLPADHLLGDLEQFHQAIILAADHAIDGQLITFGVAPTKPATGYGYIQVNNDETLPIYPVQQFVEKPGLEKAQTYCDAGNYYWNSGMFVFYAQDFLSAICDYHPQIKQHISASLDNAVSDLDFLRLNAEEYGQCERISVDYAVMERSQTVKMIPLHCQWNDIGSWSSLWESGAKDENGNVVKGDVMLESVRNSYIHSENKLVTALGVEDLIVVETHDGLMITHQSEDQNIKKIVAKLKEDDRPEVDLHRKAFRPWGNYDCIDRGDRFQVKRIMVKPGEATSMQKHYQRAEHWIVVSGTAEVTCGDDVSILTENQAAYIPLGAKHRLRNPGKTPLEIIEVQSGSYLGEDDIERFNDEYGRD